MDLRTHKVSILATNPWFVLVGGVSSIVALLWLLYDKLNAIQYEPTPVIHIIFLVITLSILAVGYFYSIKVRSENMALREVAEKFYDINNIYRETLQKMFAGDTPETDPVDLLSEEERTLRSVCQRVENIFSRLIGRNCLVTIKLITNEGGINYASTYVRSLEICERDRPAPLKYKIDAVSNSAFFKAVQKRPDGKPPHYHSGNLEKEDDYSNERQHYTRYYKSAIVVPIMGTTVGNDGALGEPDLVGFLSVDTLSKHRLNNGYHLYILSSLANQMYNFISLMRGKYTILERPENDTH